MGVGHHTVSNPKLTVPTNLAPTIVRRTVDISPGFETELYVGEDSGGGADVLNCDVFENVR